MASASPAAGTKGAAVLLLLLVAATMAAAKAAVAVKCNPVLLEPCAPAIAGLGLLPPSPECCAGLRAQRPCFCAYEHRASFRSYLNSGTAKSVLRKCGIPAPRC